MKHLFPLIALLCLVHVTIAQDLIVTDKNDSLECEITKITPDSTFYFKQGGDTYNLYGNRLDKAYVASFTYDYFTDLIRTDNARNSLWIMDIGLGYNQNNLDEPTQEVFVNDDVGKQLSSSRCLSIGIENYVLSEMKGSLSVGIKLVRISSRFRDDHVIYKEVKPSNSFMPSSTVQTGAHAGQADLKMSQTQFLVSTSYYTDANYLTVLSALLGGVIAKTKGTVDTYRQNAGEQAYNTHVAGLMFGLEVAQEIMKTGNKNALFATLRFTTAPYKNFELNYLDFREGQTVSVSNYKYINNLTLSINYRFFW